MRASRILYVVVLALCIFRFANRYAALPAVVASHFGANGQPNGWMSKSVFAWFSLIPLGANLLVTFLGSFLMARLPVSLINLPNKDYWLAPERKEQTIREFGSRMEWFGVAMLVFLGYVYELVFNANAAGGGALPSGPFISGMVAFLAFTVVWMVMLFRRFRMPH